jgi:hypothetical protein|tara:strand:- start:153 stop:455 length:303 start_codon:yes stop_codon:yes gene_type:complete
MAYGFEVYAANGTKIIDLADRVSRSVTSGTTPTITSGSYYDVSITDMTNADDWAVFAYANTPPNSLNARFVDCTRNTGSFRVSQSMGVSSSFDYIVIRTG